MNIHINKNTRLQPWNGQTVFNEYPVFIRPGNFTVTLMFHDAESIGRLNSLLADMLLEIDDTIWVPPSIKLS
jgi:hypothetical protein